MKIVLAPNAFKGSLSGSDAARAMRVGIEAVSTHFEIVEVPVSDGGDGLVDVVATTLNGRRNSHVVTGPLGTRVAAEYVYLAAQQAVVIEMAKASGLCLIRMDERDPMRASSHGTGELIKAALDLGAQTIVIGLGGSATVDGGTGAAHALGMRFLDAKGQELSPRGEDLSEINKLDASGLDPRLANTCLHGVCDVDNPMIGEEGAVRVYGPQKGATAETVPHLEAGLCNLANLFERDMGRDVRDLPGGGAAGGLGAGLVAMLGAELRPGVEVVLDMVDLDSKLQGAALCLTGEGLIDNQTIHGKAPAGVAQRARALDVPCIAIGGGVAEDVSKLHEIGIDAAFSLCRAPLTLEQALEQAPTLLAQVTEHVVRAFLSGCQHGRIGSSTFVER